MKEGCRSLNKPSSHFLLLLRPWRMFKKSIATFYAREISRENNGLVQLIQFVWVVYTKRLTWLCGQGEGSLHNKRPYRRLKLAAAKLLPPFTCRCNSFALQRVLTFCQLTRPACVDFTEHQPEGQILTLVSSLCPFSCQDFPLAKPKSNLDGWLRIHWHLPSKSANKSANQLGERKAQNGSWDCSSRPTMLSFRYTMCLCVHVWPCVRWCTCVCLYAGQRGQSKLTLFSYFSPNYFGEETGSLHWI